MRMHHIVIFGLSGSTIFLHIISWNADFWEKSYCTQNVCFDFLYNDVYNISYVNTAGRNDQNKYQLTATTESIRKNKRIIAPDNPC
jgi:hypothetical protein